MSDTVAFILNGKPVTIESEPNHRSLLDWLRGHGCTGSKEGCAEGDCGACTAVMVERDAFGKTVYRAFNSCIALVAGMHGREIITVEGIEQKGELHPVQQQMVACAGSQCGFCTPGFIASMFEGYHRADLASQEQISDQLNGNLCRCTGYRPIRDAMKKALAERAERPQDLFQLRLTKDAPALGSLHVSHAGSSFQRPANLDQLVHLKAADPVAELVCGATEIGVYINKKGARYASLIAIDGVPELVACTEDDKAFSLGASASLTAVGEALAGAFPLLDKMLLAFASRPIRNRATLGGNLVTASPIGDMAPVLLALDAQLVLASVRGTRQVALAEFFTGYRKTILASDEVMVSVILPKVATRAGITRLSNSYKVSKRRELDISIVAAALVIEHDADGRVVHARLGFGGVAATPARALKTEAFLLGKMWNTHTVQEAMHLLESEFSPLSDVRSGKEFRVGLTGSLLKKFFDGATSLAQDAWLDFSADGPWQGEDASRALRHESARGHVTGAARYVDDEAHRRPMLEIWPVTSPHAHARILSVDTTAALAMPGVHLVLTASDIPGVNDIGAVRHDETLLAKDEVLFHGHMVAVAVANSYELARAAAAAVVVVYEALPVIVGLENAIRQDSFHTAAHIIVRGDAAAAHAAAPHKLAGTLAIGGQEHFYLEAQASWAELGDDGDMHVSASTQHPSEVQAVVSHVLAIPRHRVVVESPRMGGGFGGKETQGNGFAALVALASLRTGKPVRVQLDRDLDMAITGKRHPFYASFQAGFDAQGMVHSAQVELVNDGGWALDLSESICDRALFHLDNAYYLPNVRFSGRVAKTHTVSHTAFRGFGGPQGMVVIEEILDQIARTLGLAPEVVRARNLYRGEGESNTTHYGQALGDHRIQTIWNRLLNTAKLDERRAAIAVHNANNPMIKRGIAMTPVKFGISFTATFLNQAGALVHIYRDGTVQVNHGGTEMGQGLNTKLLGVAMRELGVTQDAVRVMKTRTDKVPNTSATAASAGSDLNGQAVKAACEALRERLTPVAVALLNVKDSGKTDFVLFDGGYVVDAANESRRISFAEVAEQAYFRQISLSANGFYRTPGIGYDKAKGKGKPFYYFAYGAAVCEVEVDGYSGMKRVLDVQILQDVGDSLNPSVDRGQIEGAFVQGMGWLTSEELKWTPDGRLLSHSASTYQIPSIGDAPAKMTVELLENAGQSGVIHGSKAVGEPPLMLALSVREAIRDAVASFGNGGLVALPAPSTHEAIFAAVQEQLRSVRAEAAE